MKLFVTGGHVTPALAVMEEISRMHPDWDVLFLGRTRALEGRSTVSEEEFLVTSAGFRFVPIVAGRFTRALSVSSVLSFLRIPIGFMQALMYCLRHRPDAIVSFGGYIALPVVVAGWILGIPTVTHEQTLAPGIANRIIGAVARNVCVTFKETVNFFPKNRTIITGLPVRRGFDTPHSKAPFPITNHIPLLYITGGATGAVTLNRLLFPIIGGLVERFQIVHQTGEPSYEAAVAVRNALPVEKQSRYIVTPYIHMPELSWIVHHADIVVGRSGANTVIELALFGNIAVLVPLPWSGAGEQQKNAQWLSGHGTAVIVDQKTATPDALADAITKMFAHKMSYKEKAKKLANTMPRDGARRMLNVIEQVTGV